MNRQDDRCTAGRVDLCRSRCWIRPDLAGKQVEVIFHDLTRYERPRIAVTGNSS